MERVGILFGTEHPNQAHLLHPTSPGFPVISVNGIASAQVAGYLPSLAASLLPPTTDQFYLSNIFSVCVACPWCHCRVQAVRVSPEGLVMPLSSPPSASHPLLQGWIPSTAPHGPQDNATASQQGTAYKTSHDLASVYFCRLISWQTKL